MEEKLKQKKENQILDGVETDGKLKMFSHVESEERSRLFSHVEPGEKFQLFSHVDPEERPSVFSHVEPVEKGESFSRTSPDVEYKVHSDIKTEILKSKPDAKMMNVVTECVGFKSSNFELELLSIEKVMEEIAGKSIGQIRYKFVIKMSHGHFVANVGVGELENFRWVKEATEGRAYFREKKAVAEFSIYVHEIIERDILNAVKEIYFKTNGWKQSSKGGLVFVCDTGIIGSSTSNIKANSDLKFQIDSDIKAFDNWEQFYRMQGICVKEEIIQVLLTFVNMSVMTTFFEKAGFPIKFIMGIMGTTNTMKTSLAMVFTHIFNALQEKSPELTFSSTRAGIETYVSKYADSILLIDDFMPGEDKSKQAELNSKLELICRLYGDRASKKRMTIFAGKDVEYPVRGCCMITGEHLTGVESSRTRIVCINLEKGDIKKDILSWYQEHPLILPTYLYGFIEYLSQNQVEVIETIKNRTHEYRKKMNFQIERYNEVAAQYFVTLDIMFSYWKERGFINGIEKIDEKWKGNIQKIIYQNDKALRKISIVNVILQALEEELMGNPRRIKCVEDIKRSDKRLIYHDAEYIYIQQKELYIIVKEYCKRFDYSFYLQPNMISEKLKEKDVLECITNSAGHIESARKLKQSKGITQRYLFIKKLKMSSILESAV